jgi:hypothetical protein
MRLFSLCTDWLRQHRAWHCFDTATVMRLKRLVRRVCLSRGLIRQHEGVHPVATRLVGRKHTAQAAAQRVSSVARMARSSAPIAIGSITVARCTTWGVVRVPRRSIDGSRSARPVAMAYRKTIPPVLRSRLTVSYNPRPSSSRSSANNSRGVI